MDYLPEKEYQKIIKSMPIFCIDFLISFQKKYLLIKRKEEPLKNLYWVIGGRLMFKEKITVNRDAITGNKLNHNCEVVIFESIGRKLVLFLILICNQKIDNG